MDDLVSFLLARLDEDEAAARAAAWGPWVVGPTFGGENNRVYVKPEGPGIDTIGTCVIAGQVSNMPSWRANAQHIARWDPARVLAEVEAKRRILDEHPPFDADVEPCCRTCGSHDGAGSLTGEWPCATLRLLALPHAEHPDYRPEWRP